MPGAFFFKDPDSVEDFTVDWSAHLASGETISTSVWSVPAGITQDSETETTTTATITVSGGTLDAFYTLTNRITTSGGRTLDQSIHIRMVSK